MDKTWLVLGVLNTTLVTLVASFAIIPLLLAKQLEYDNRDLQYTTTKAWRFKAREGSWLQEKVLKKMRVAGLASGNFIVIRPGLSEDRETSVIKHEEAHVIQFYAYGPLQPVIYGGHWLYIAITATDFSKHAYYDNIFERQARKWAGQQVDIPREEWGNPDNRFFWW